MKTYSFDCKLWAVAHVQASSAQEAERMLFDAIDCINIGYNDGGIKLTEASIETADYDPEMEHIS